MAEKMTPKESVLRSKSSEERWHCVSDEYESSLSERFVPKKYKNLIQLGCNQFYGLGKRKKRTVYWQLQQMVPENILESGDKELLNKWLTLILCN